MGAPSLDRRVEILERQVFGLRTREVARDKRIDTVCSWPWKRAWWVANGFLPYSVGRWYEPAPAGYYHDEHQ